MKKNSVPVVALMIGGVLVALLLFWGIQSIKKAKSIDPQTELQEYAELTVDESSQEATKEEAIEESILEKETEDLSDLESERAPLVEYFNSHYSERQAYPYFVNLDGDADQEMIVVVEPEGIETCYYDHFCDNTELVIFDQVNGEIKEILNDPVNKRYFLLFNEEETGFLIYSTLPNFTFYEEEDSEEFYEVHIESGQVISEAISEEAYNGLRPGAISLNELLKNGDRTRMLIRPISSAAAYDYSSDRMHLVSNLAKEENMVVNDAMYINDGSGLCLYASLGPAFPDVCRDYSFDDTDYYIDGFFEVVCVDESLNLYRPGKIMLADPEDEYGDSDLTVSQYGVFHFGEIEHYYVDVEGVEFETQYKYGDVGGDKGLLDSEMLFIQGENGVQCASYRSWWDTCTATEYVDIAFEDGMYKQYAAYEVSSTEVEAEATNWEDVYSECMKDIYALDRFYIFPDDEGVDIIVDNVSLKDIKKGVNGKFYFSFTYHAQVKWWVAPEYDFVGYYTYRVEGNKLIRESFVGGIDKLETSTLNLPVIYN
ncbi:MAG: hypothetical protein K5891_05045 [Lachnospiraceae bacterium]|nr:hypothetical protein [Lachnospiraceae bacterium]